MTETTQTATCPACELPMDPEAVKAEAPVCSFCDEVSALDPDSIPAEAA